MDSLSAVGKYRFVLSEASVSGADVAAKERHRFSNRCDHSPTLYSSGSMSMVYVALQLCLLCWYRVTSLDRLIDFFPPEM